MKRHSARGRRRHQARQSWQHSITRCRFTMTLSEFNVENLRLAFLGTAQAVSEVTQ